MIECNTAINFGQPTLKGRRLTVFNIVAKLFYEETIDLALKDYEITRIDAYEAAFYCANTHCKNDKNLQNYCDGCILRTIQEGCQFNTDDFSEFATNKARDLVISKDEKIYFSGSLEELENSEFGKVAWLLAEDVLKKVNEGL